MKIKLTDEDLDNLKLYATFRNLIPGVQFPSAEDVDNFAGAVVSERLAFAAQQAWQDAADRLGAEAMREAWIEDTHAQFGARLALGCREIRAKTGVEVWVAGQDDVTGRWYMQRTPSASRPAGDRDDEIPF